MTMKTWIRVLCWSTPWLLQSGCAHAWGLYTHVYFAQWLLWGVPLLDGELRRAVSRYPKLVMAGACLPDLAIVGHLVGTAAFDRTHCWQNAAEMMASVQSDAERALMLGFYSHLFADVVAHHHFVPSHERLWGNKMPMAAHIACEWAMDAHVSSHVLIAPSVLLGGSEPEIVALISRCFNLRPSQATRAVRVLAQADKLLRWARLPQGLYHSLAQVDGCLERRFNHFIRQTSERFHEMNHVLSGEIFPANANGEAVHVAQARLASVSERRLRLGQYLPANCFL